MMRILNLAKAATCSHLKSHLSNPEQPLVATCPGANVCKWLLKWLLKWLQVAASGWRCCKHAWSKVLHVQEVLRIGLLGLNILDRKGLPNRDDVPARFTEQQLRNFSGMKPAEHQARN